MGFLGIDHICCSTNKYILQRHGKGCQLQIMGPSGCAKCISTLICEIVLCRNDIAEVAHVLAKTEGA